MAAAEMAFAGDLGLALELERVPTTELDAGYDPLATRLFSESCTRFLVEVQPEDAEAFEAHFHGLDCARVGAVTAEPRLVLAGLDGAPVAELELDALRAAHQGGVAG